MHASYANQLISSFTLHASCARIVSKFVYDKLLGSSHEEYVKSLLQNVYKLM